MTRKLPPKKASARKGTQEDEIAQCIARHCRDLPDGTRRDLLVTLRSIPPFIRKYADDVRLEKDRKRQVEKVRLNAIRLKSALDELDDEARGYVGLCMTGGDHLSEFSEARILHELRSLSPLFALSRQLGTVATAKATNLPLRLLNDRPEFMIADDLCKALTKHGLVAVASDIGLAADLFLAIASASGIKPGNSPRYWIRKALDNPI